MTATREFKAFLWRHPEIHGPTRKELLLDDVRAGLKRAVGGFIFSNLRDPDTMHSLANVFRDNLQQMVTEQRISDYSIYDATPHIHTDRVLQVVLQAALIPERIVIDLTIKP